jgi:hypothetical protein
MTEAPQVPPTADELTEAVERKRRADLGDRSDLSLRIDDFLAGRIDTLIPGCLSRAVLDALPPRLPSDPSVVLTAEDIFLFTTAGTMRHLSPEKQRQLEADLEDEDSFVNKEYHTGLH